MAAQIMNPIEFLFCWAPIGMGVIVPAIYLLSLAMAHKAKADEHRARAQAQARTLELRQADADRRAQLHEARIARENNAVVLQEAKLELEQLKIRKEMREQGLTAEPFTPDEFTPKQ